MYAKLVVGSGTNINASQAARDIVRLITSSSPSISNISFFSTSTSIVLDATPSGWSYVGSNSPADQPTVAAPGSANTTFAHANWCMSAPTTANSSVLKYAVLTIAEQLSNTTITVSGCQNANATGVLVNEGWRAYGPNTSANDVYVANTIVGYPITTGMTLHVIANPQHITIINEGVGFDGIWETSQTDAHTFYNIAPFVQIHHSKSSQTGILSGAVPVAANSAFTGTSGINAIVFNVTNPNNATNYGTYQVTQNYNRLSLINNNTGYRVNAITATGSPAYAITPIYFTASDIGYPTQFVTGICPLYYVSGNLGNSLDTVSINGDSYYFFNCGTSFGLLAKTY
jgi:hypothetical protein